MDLVFREKLKDLRVYQDREQLANPAQTYEIQKFVVSTSEKIRQYGLRCLQLNDLKKVAIENEDYLTAKQIKNELETIKATIGDIEINFNVAKTKNQKSIAT